MPNSNHPEIVKANHEDRNRVADFVMNFARVDYSFSTLDWEYPADDLVGGLYIIKQKEEYIGSQGMIPIKLRFLDEVILSAKSETSALVPNFRGLGYFEKLYAAAIEDCKNNKILTFWGFTALDKVWNKKLLFEVDGNMIWEAIYILSYIESFKDLLKFTPGFKRKMIDFAKLTGRFILQSASVKRHQNKQLTVNCVDISLDENFMRFAQLYKDWAATNRGLVALDMSQDFISWRVINNPAVKYQSFFVFDEDRLVAAAIINTSARLAYIVELLCPDSTLILSVFNSLVKYCKSNLCLAKIAFWGNPDSAYGGMIFDSMAAVGSNLKPSTTMKFVYKQFFSGHPVNVALPFGDRSKIYINGLWTEGLKI